jgi:tetratricopeptide (TPR) repeat protein
LDFLGRVEEAIPFYKQWYEMQSELFALYPEGQKLLGDDLTAARAGKLEEATGDYEAAVASYRLARKLNLIKDNGSESDYDLDLGIARSLRKIGDLGEANATCDRWRKHWRGLALTSHRKLQPDEVRPEGIPEIGGKWEFSCGNPKKGLQMIESSVKKYPNSEVAFDALSDYYYSIGDISRAREAEKRARSIRSR